MLEILVYNTINK